MSELNEDMQPTFPSDEIACKRCMYRKDGLIGYKNRYCEKYPSGKPLGILLDGDECGFYRVKRGLR